jgi:hypothetical protein
MIRKWQIPRRTFLKGLGTCISLPLLEAMVRPASLLAANATANRPLRMGFIYVPNGANMADWTPSQTGTDFELPSILEPLADVRSELQVLTGLAHQKAFANGDGAGDHARANATFLTGCQARKTAGADIRVGVSVDQVAAARIGRSTRLPSLELSCDKGQMAGECDSGYACAYQFHLSWRSESVPNPAEVNPRQVFERLFGSGPAGEQVENRMRREQARKSILDFALDDAQRLRQNLGRTDQQKLDEYLGSVRELELRLENARHVADNMPAANRPDGIPEHYEEHIRLMFDLLTLAFQTDSTRIATFSLAHDGSNRPYPFIGVAEGHHDLSHHEGKAEKKEKIVRINRFHMTQFAYFLKRLQSIKEGEGSLLDNCMLVYGSGLADGNAHNHDNLPVLLAGRGAGTLHPGRHVKFDGKVPMANLYLAMLERMSVPAEHLGDSTGRLTDV